MLNRTLQEVKRPQLVLREMLRVARKGIVAFPNFAHIGNRLALLRTGVMPVSEALPHNWHDTPNIHLFSLDDFRILCRQEDIRIEEIRYSGRAPAVPPPARPWAVPTWARNSSSPASHGS